MLLIPYTVCDVFTDRPLTGNQLAVFTDAPSIPEELLQPLALEMGFAESTFVYPPSGDGDVRMRIFTPGAELPFAGHPTLGTAVVVGASLGVEHVRLETGVGVIEVALSGSRGRMRQPVPTVASWDRVDELLRAVGVERSELPVEVYDNGIRHAFVTLADARAVAAVEPDVNALVRLDEMGVSCVAAAGRRWKTRVFSPAPGVFEDAATGSAAGPLACHLARHGLVPFGEQIEISQGAEMGRPSMLYACATGSADRIESVEVEGSAVVVARGEFRLPT